MGMKSSVWEEFRSSGLPSRGADVSELMKKLDEKSVESILSTMQRMEPDECDLAYEYRKLRELVAIRYEKSLFSDGIFKKVYEAACEWTLENEEFAEFLVAARKIMEVGLESSLVRDNLLLYYVAIGEFDEFASIFYKLYSKETPSENPTVIVVVNILIAVSEGNPYQLEKLLSSGSYTKSLCNLLRNRCHLQLKKSCEKAFLKDKIPLDWLSNKCL